MDKDLHLIDTIPPGLLCIPASLSVLAYHRCFYSTSVYSYSATIRSAYRTDTVDRTLLVRAD